MDKVKKFLEGYVQWLALALGVAFLGYTVYFYVLEKPVKVASVGSNSDVSPADVDKIVHDGPAATLKTAVENKTPLVVKQPDESIVPNAIKGFELVDQQPFTKPWTPTGRTPSTEDDDGNSRNASSNIVVQKLPEIPALTNIVVSTGHSNVPAQAVAAAGANQQLAVDKNWQSVEGTVPCAAIAKAFEDAKIPKNLQITCMLRVYLVREERNRNGSWSAPTTMPSIEIDPLKDLPSNSDSQDLQNDYKAWAESNTPLICQPAFYTVLQGDAWYEPGTTNPNQANDALQDDGFDPLHPDQFKGDPALLTPKHKEQYDEYLKRKAALESRGRQQNNRGPTFQPPPGPGGAGPAGNTGGGAGGGGNGGGGRGRRLADDPQRGQVGDTLRPPPPPGFEPGPPPLFGQPAGMPGGQPGAANTAAAAAGLPTGSFDPSQQTPFKVWAHDDSALSGHTYRYMLKYVVTSPVWHSTNLCKDQKMADVFSIVSADSAWTDAVNVESDTNFYAVEVKGKGIHFRVFKWKNGVWQMEEVQQASAGDMIGSQDTAGTKTDFTTGWTLVDVRDDPRDTDNRIIVLVSENGTIKKKELTIDQRSAEYQHLFEEVSKTKAAAAAAAPGAPNG